MPTVATAAIAAAAFAALYAGHHLGDHPIQPNSAAAAKGIPTDDRLAAGAHPWTGWSSCARHVATYGVTQAVALALIALVAPIGWAGAAAALITSMSTHAVIDRRWIVRHMIRAKGCQDWADAPYLLDQSLHIAVLLVAAVLAAAVTGPAGVAATAAVGAALVVGALLVERCLARAALARPLDPFLL